MNPSINQLYLMQSCRKLGIPENFVPIFLVRCGASEAEYQDLVKQGMVETKDGRIQLTKAGKRVFKREHQRGYF